MKKKFIQGLLACLLPLFTQLPALAEDIDLFLGVSATATSAPNVLLMVDNTANWNTPFVAEKAALVNTFNGLTTNTFNVGVMMFTETSGADSGNDGGYVRAAIRPMTAANKTRYANMINALDVGNDKSNGGKIGKAMEEAYLYYSGGTPHAGNSKAKTDYTGNVYSPSPAALGAALASSRAVWAVSGNALTSKTATTYQNPLAASGCAGRNYIIYISNGAAQDNASDITQANGALTARGGDATQISINPTGSATNPADEWARFMKASSLGITVYTIDINKLTTGQGPGWTALLKSVASVSGGKYFDVAGNTTAISNALNTILSEIQSVNSVFASVSLPVSVNTQGTYLNQVYVGMFRPDADALPLWAGNLKQYKLGYVGTDLKLLDGDDRAAINNLTGFITECARSFWTPTTANTAWANKGWPAGSTFCIPPTGSSATLYKDSDFPDGNLVEKGGQGYKLRSTTTRTVKTCGATMATCASSTDLVAFSNTSVSQAQLGAADTTERDAIINWAKGLDVKDEDSNTITTTETRRSAHGDVVHSRPVAINFGTEAAPQVVVFYGGNDGLLRAINGNRTNSIGSYTAGSELWSFAPPEFFSKFKRIYDNSVRVSYPGAIGLPLPKPYGMDGPITAFKGAVVSTQKAFIYATMRRGGRSMYAFDVTDALTAPNSPVLKWRVGCADATDTDCKAGWSGLGQTWSSPKSFYASGYSGGDTPMLIMGGGYDTCEDADPNTCTSTSKGHYVYIVNADTGAILKTFDTGFDRSVIADSTIVRDGAGMAIYAYTSDMGGNVYRITMGAGAPASWTMKRIAALGCATTATCAANRKFMFAPSVVASGSDYTIMLGSGDREKPLNYYTSAASVANAFYMFTDKPTVVDTTYPGTADCGTAVICLSSLYAITTSATPSATDLAAKKGWYLGMTSTEQIVTSAVTIFGNVTFSTHQPAVAAASCTSNLGTSRVYNISYINAASLNGTANRYEHLSGDGLPPSPVAGMVTLDSGQTVPFCIGCSKDSPLEGKQPSASSSAIRPKGRVYWYIQQ